jgi:hypothetical protein|tara:strand:+ start:694 stop:930 length:237 start_codon:yes stop_codon:yes gene_type:complete
MTEENKIINIDGKEYNKDDLSNEQTYCVNQLTDLQNKSNNLRFQLDQVSASQTVFLEKLKTSLGNQETTKAMEDSKAG